ncbi:ribosomal protein S18-alanine N-acetyltransferase [Demequina sp. NBRC 110053]|uniref:ribosomal protein S18-alanine N-acetyltransferase n=1 Tax=Demequina sp. NBRC 110053 TaxID=1570342 RepID=UPI0009FD33B8|nr:ribosomal protein S18-alanine N-acetyltransferase [Demequina sp. NBRC 110053]
MAERSGDDQLEREGDGQPAVASALIRDLADGDVPRVAALEQQIFGRSAWSPALIREELLVGFSRWRGIDQDGSLAAYAVYGFEGDAFHLMNLAVAPEARGRGLARALMADLLAEAARLAAPDVWLEVAVTNGAALALYRAHGFEDVRVRRKYYQPEGVDALVMRRVGA